jgi:hypothetical protein
MAFTKDDSAKVDLTLFPMEAMEAVCRVLEFGVKKYSREGWRQGQNDPEAQRRILGAMLRHYAALQRGETIDPETGEHHVFHMAANAIFLATFSEVNRRYEELPDLDDDDAMKARMKARIETAIFGDVDVRTAGRAGRTVREKIDNLRRDRSAVEGQTGLNCEPNECCTDPNCQICF